MAEREVLPEPKPEMADGAEALYSRYQSANSLAVGKAEEAASCLTASRERERRLREALEPFAEAARETDFSECGRVRNSWWFDDDVIKRAGAALAAADGETGGDK